MSSKRRSVSSVVWKNFVKAFMITCQCTLHWRDSKYDYSIVVYLVMISSALSLPRNG